MTTYSCPMHPEETQDTPGTCSKCHMKLVPVESESEECKDGMCDHHKDRESRMLAGEGHDHAADNASLNKMAASATLHCLTGCAIGEVAGLVIGAILGLGAVMTMILAITLAFLSGYILSTLPLRKAGLGFFAALSIVFAADTLSIATMEVVDNVVMFMIPGAMTAGLANPIFWVSMPIALAVAYMAAYPVNRYLLTRGKGHALVMKYHQGHAH